MNLKKTWKIILTIVFLLTSKIKNSSEEAVEEPEEVAEAVENEITCPLELIKSLGMEGLEKGAPFKLDMCPNIKNSCCKISDQEIIYKNWIEGKEKSNLEERFQFHEKVYNNFLNHLEEIFLRATTLVEKLNIIEISDCKAISNRISHFKFPEIFTILKKSLKQMHNFFDISSSGIYCSICDADLSQYFDLKNKEIKLEEKFCREIISNSLHPLIYFHSHLPIVVNLISSFLVNCDNDGVFLDKVVPSEFLFHKPEETSKILQDCKTSRNDSNWLEKCLPICKNFEVTRFSNFFQPNLEEFKKYTVFLTDNIKRLEKEAEKEDVITDEGTGPARLLTEEPKTTDTGTEESKKEVEVDPSTKFENMDILTLGSKSIIAEYKNNFVIDGIDLYEIGKNSLINEEVLNTVKALDAAAIESGEVLQGEGEGEGGGEENGVEGKSGKASGGEHGVDGIEEGAENGIKLGDVLAAMLGLFVFLF